jgi:hypothetical protein
MVSDGLQMVHLVVVRYSLARQQAAWWEASPQQVRLGDDLFCVMYWAW